MSSMATERDHYAVLGLTIYSSRNDVQRAYDALASRLNPENHYGAWFQTVTDKRHEVDEAYAVLSHPEKRTHYNAHDYPHRDRYVHKPKSDLSRLNDVLRDFQQDRVTQQAAIDLGVAEMLKTMQSYLVSKSGHKPPQLG